MEEEVKIDLLVLGQRPDHETPAAPEEPHHYVGGQLLKLKERLLIYDYCNHTCQGEMVLMSILFPCSPTPAPGFNRPATAAALMDIPLLFRHLLRYLPQSHRRRVRSRGGTSC